jgi:uncharacterized protein YecE (DUF72 family)
MVFDSSKSIKMAGFKDLETERIYIGTSGWNYKSWKEKFYPKALSQKDWLGYYSKRYNSVEINNTFYQLPKKETFKNWYRSTPDDFLFSIKASRYITHLKKLKNCKEAVDKLLEYSSGLDKKIGIFLFQMPANQRKDYTKLENFLKLLPEKYRYAFEFRHDSWFDDGIYRLLHNSNCGIVINSSPRFPYKDIATGNICYIRMHGSKKLYSSKYSKDELKEFAEIIIKYHNRGFHSYIYFNNDVHGYAVENARELHNLIDRM